MTKPTTTPTPEVAEALPERRRVVIYLDVFGTGVESAADEIVYLLKPGYPQRNKRVYIDTVAEIITRNLSGLVSPPAEQMKAACGWTFDETSHLVDWETRCGVKVSDIGYDEYEQFKFCPFCGGRLPAPPEGKESK